jgi:cytochrome c-type biogenesis protein
VTGSSVATLVALPLGLGLLGFVEPCTIGSSLLFIKYIEGRSRAGTLAEVGLFAITRALFFGALGIAAVALGTAFFGFQRAGWIALGALYAGFGATYLAGRAGALMIAAGPSLSRVSELGGSAGLGVLFGLNIPACATPLLVALFGTAVAGGAGGASFARGFVSLALFGLALSLPLVLAVLVPAARRALDGIAGLSRPAPFWTGVVLIGLGLWSIGFGLFASTPKLG